MTSRRPKKQKPKTRSATDAECREFASWVAQYRTIAPQSFDYERFGKLVENKAQELFREKCVECGQ